jgi:hypothetical protein
MTAPSMGRDRGTRGGVAVDGSVHQVNRVRAVDGEGTESRSTAANNKLDEFVGKQPFSDQRDSGGPRKSNLFLTQNILIHTIVQGLSGPGGPSRDQESPAAASRTNRQIDLRTETPPRADRLAPNTALRGAHPRPASKEINA